VATEASKAGKAFHNLTPLLCFSRCLPLIMEKLLLQKQVLERLAEDLLLAEQAVRAAHETATHEENIAENKYDTLGLEAAYLATGQARHAEEIRQRWPICANSARAPMTLAKVSSSARSNMSFGGERVQWPCQASCALNAAAVNSISARGMRAWWATSRQVSTTPITSATMYRPCAAVRP
jgi:hypothetical protein